jgi:hypothetical protein
VQWVARIRKSIALRGYLRRLGPLLVRRYGYQEAYSPGRITSTIERHRLSQRHVEYACAMYATRERFVMWMQNRTATAAQALPSPVVAEAPNPYRSRLHDSRDLLGPDVNYAAWFDVLRTEVAERYGRGSRRFVPRVERNFERYSNGDNPSAAARWGLGL